MMWVLSGMFDSMHLLKEMPWRGDHFGGVKVSFCYVNLKIDKKRRFPFGALSPYLLQVQCLPKVLEHFL